VLTHATNALDEQTALRAAIAGDPVAFAELFRSHYPMIHAFAYRLSLNADDAHDIAQETFIKAARSIATFKPDRPIRNWLYTICANTARDWRRRETRRGHTLAEFQIDAPTSHTDDLPDFDAAHRALDELTPRLREAIVLVIMEQMTHAQAAQILGCAETTISWRIFQAKRQLKKTLTRHGQR